MMWKDTYFVSKIGPVHVFNGFFPRLDDGIRKCKWNLYIFMWIYSWSGLIDLIKFFLFMEIKLKQ